MPSQSRLVLVAQMLGGLSFIHSTGCMHRDIKLDNILGSAQPLQAVIIDFGHATWEKESSDHMKGTVRYLAPEIMALKQGKSKTPYDNSVDIWSLGLTIFEFLCRWRFNQTFMGASSHRGILNREHWNKQHSKDEDVRDFFDLVSQMLAWDAVDRISSRDALNWVEARGLSETSSLRSGGKRSVSTRNLQPAVTIDKKARVGRF